MLIIFQNQNQETSNMSLAAIPAKHWPVYVCVCVVVSLSVYTL